MLCGQVLFKTNNLPIFSLNDVAGVGFLSLYTIIVGLTHGNKEKAREIIHRMLSD